MANKGSFVKGYDPRRKLLTREDRQRGYFNAPRQVQCRIRGLYKAGRIVRRGETIYPELAF